MINQTIDVELPISGKTVEANLITENMIRYAKNWFREWDKEFCFPEDDSIDDLVDRIVYDKEKGEDRPNRPYSYVDKMFLIYSVAIESIDIIRYFTHICDCGHAQEIEVCSFDVDVELPNRKEWKVGKNLSFKFRVLNHMPLASWFEHRFEYLRYKGKNIETYDIEFTKRDYDRIYSIFQEYIHKTYEAVSLIGTNDIKSKCDKCGKKITLEKELQKGILDDDDFC